jgi:signal transduction histidine kinase
MITSFTTVRWPTDEGSDKLRAGQQTTRRSGQRVDSADTMKRKLSALSQQYVTALKKHLKQGSRASLESARGLGRQAVASGLETLDVARMHAGALAALEASSSRDGVIKRAEIFFAETIIPIEKTHQAAVKASLHLSQLHKTLGRRAVDLATSNQSLKQGIARRKTAEQALKKSGKRSKKLLEESRRLQKHLQHLTHRILSAQENRRKKISHDLQDEIAQTLLGINVRLLTLKKEAGLNAAGLQKEIASTRRLVDKSVAGIKRFAREYRKHHET